MVEWAATLGRILGRRSGFAVPQILLGAILGELGQALIPGQRIVPRMALQGGYSFSYPNLTEALRSLLGESG
jgi:NAD dependent epimerase/dehydratase family enzyme